jgi:septum formation protein
VKLILGSASPRRKEILAQVGIIPFEIRAPNIDETPLAKELPLQYCRRITEKKIQALKLADDEIAICADTTVAVGRRILVKPSDRDEANSFLSLLSGRRHKVITCVAVRKQNKIRTKEVVSRVKMRVLGFEEKEFYLNSGDWEGKAGGYGIQGIASSFIPWIGGSYTGIVGLPLTETIGLLRTFGYPVFSEKNG